MCMRQRRKIHNQEIMYDGYAEKEDDSFRRRTFSIDGSSSLFPEEGGALIIILTDDRFMAGEGVDGVEEGMLSDVIFRE